MVKIKIAFCILFLFCSTLTFGHGENLGGLILSTSYNKDFKNNKSLIGIDLNSYFKYFNAGLIYQYSFNAINTNANQVGFMVGLGVLQFFQSQVGYNTNNEIFLRQKVSFKTEDIFTFAKSGFYEKITFSVNADKFFNSNQYNWVFGFSIGYTWNLDDF